MSRSFVPVGAAFKPRRGLALDMIYKGCTCCGRVVPDVAPTLGACEMCKTPQVLLDGPPEGWHEQVDIRSPGQIERDETQPQYRSRWLLNFEARQTRCEHEQAWEATCKAKGRKAWKRRRAA